MFKKVMLAFLGIFFLIPFCWGEYLELPPPVPGSFVTVFSSLPDCRQVAFDGFHVFIENGTGWEEIGRLPDKFLGGTDPAFILPTPEGHDLLLGGGYGGFKGFYDPTFNGTLFQMSIDGGEARLITRIPFHVQAAFHSREKVFLTVGSRTFSEGSVRVFEHFDRHDQWKRKGDAKVVVDNIPGAPGGLTLDKTGNLYVGLGFGANPGRTGEIRKFRWNHIQRAIHKERPIDYENGTYLTQLLNAGHLVSLDNNKKAIAVGGGDLYGYTRSYGYYAIVNSETGDLMGAYDPTDEDPWDHDFLFYILSYCPSSCLLSAVDLNTFFLGARPTVYPHFLCENPKSLSGLFQESSDAGLAEGMSPGLRISPNPFQKSTIFNYELPEKQSVNLTVYDTAGRVIEILVTQIQESGNYTVRWDSFNLPSGVYFSRLKTDSSIITKKLLLIH
jgi:hypothetical protein